MRFKLKCIILALLWTSVGCFQKDSTPATDQPKNLPTPTAPQNNEEMQDGGISAGGGGDTVPSNPTTPQHIESILLDIKRDLRTYLKKQLYHNHFYGVEKALFTGPVNLLDVLEKTDLEIRMKSPCFNKNGVEVDGSIHASRPDTICISAFRIAKQVDKDLAQKQVFALILHELSHLMGFDEAQAIEYQKQVLQEISPAELGQVEDLVIQARDQFSVIISKLNFYKQSLDTNDLNLMNEKAREGLEVMSQLTHLQFSLNNFGFFDKIESDYFEFLQDRILLTRFYLNSIDPSMENYYKELYSKVFQSDQQITLKELHERHLFGTTDNVFVNSKIQKIQNMDDLKNEIENISKSLSPLEVTLNSLFFGLTLSDSRSLNTQLENPFAKFLGIYQVIENQCSKSQFAYAEKIRIEQQKDRWMMVISGNGFYSTQSLMDDQSSPITIQVGGVTHLSGDEKTAEKTYQFGQLWPNHQFPHYHDGLKITQNSQGETVLKVESKFNNHDKVNGEYVHKNDSFFCELKLQPTTTH